jgi:UTP--glucose-1-phosphate uridylyltransferase
MSAGVAERVREQIRGLPPDVNALLARHRFDLAQFLGLVRRWQAGGPEEAACRIACRIAPLPDEAIVPCAAEGSAEHRAADARGRELIGAGRVGALVLNGGMSTRFGGVVKGALEVLPGRTFLGLRLEQLACLPGTVPAFVMNSFATDHAVAEHLAGLRPEVPVHTFTQGIAVRLTPEGGVFRDPADPLATLYAPGHGDAPAAFRASGLWRGFREAGGEWLVVSNVDNVGATVDPAIVGQVAASGKRLAVELAERYAGDAGGLPAAVDGRPQIVEAFRLPEGFDDSPIRRFNTNTLIMHASLFEEDRPLTWFTVRKKVGDSPVVQFERLIGELTAFEETLFLAVPREGPRSRFLPVKTPADLERVRPAIAEVAASWPRRPALS